MKMSLTETINDFDLKRTKENMKIYFANLEKLKWEQARLNIQRGLIANYEAADKGAKRPYVTTLKDEFNLVAKEGKEAELKKRLSGYYWAKSILSAEEQLYITEYFINGKYEDEVVGLLGINSSDSRAFRKIKRNAIYKFAYVLNLVV